jgi:hypothetical protein
MKKFFLSFLLSLLGYYINAQILIPFSIGENYGYVNENLEVIIKPKYRKASCFSDDGFAIVNIDGTNSGVINKNDDLILRVNTGIIYHICDDLYSYSPVNTNEAIVVRLRSNTILSNKIGANGSASKDGFIFATFLDSNDRYGFINLDGKRVLSKLKLRRESYSFYEQRAIITDENWDHLIIDLDGNSIGDLKFAVLGQRYSEGLVPAKTYDGITGYVDTTGNFAFTISFIALNFTNATNFNGGYAMIKTNEYPPTWNIINKNGELICGNIQVSAAKDFSEGYSCVNTFDRNTGVVKYGYIDKQGTFLINPILDYADDFQNGFARIIYQGRNGLMNIQGKVFWSDEIISGKTIPAVLVE